MKQSLRSIKTIFTYIIYNDAILKKIKKFLKRSKKRFGKWKKDTLEDDAVLEFHEEFDIDNEMDEKYVDFKD